MVLPWVARVGDQVTPCVEARRGADLEVRYRPAPPVSRANQHVEAAVAAGRIVMVDQRVAGPTARRGGG